MALIPLEQQGFNLSKETLDFLQREGFVLRDNNSYTVPYEMCPKCLYKAFGYYGGRSWPVSIYIGKGVIGVDIEYSCGGDSGHSELLKWVTEEEFEEHYNNLHKYINNY